MSQNIVDFSGNPTGSGLLDDYLDKELQNILTSNSGIQRPSYAVAGTKWLDTSVTPWLWKMYDGTEDVVIGTVDTSAHKFVGETPMTTTGDLIVQNEDGNPARLASGTAGTVLTSNGVGQIPSWQKSPYQTTDNLSQTLDTSTEKYPSNAAVKAAIDTKITNCLTSIPQDIKLELVDGVLTLKAGSKVYKGDGSNIILNNDLVVSPSSGNGTFVVFVNIALNKAWANQSPSACTSGTTPPTGTGMFYNTSTKVVGFYKNGVLDSDNWSLPLAIVTVQSGAVTSIDQVFNGFGYIGSTIFALPGVSGLIPNGRNEDGSLKNTEFVTDTVSLYSFSDYTRNDEYILIKGNVLGYSNVDLYNSDLNKVFYLNIERDWAFVGRFSCDSAGKITSLTPKTAFHAFDENDVDSRIIDIMDNNLTNYYTKTESDNKFDLKPTVLKPSGDNHGYIRYNDGSDNPVKLCWGIKTSAGTLTLPVAYTTTTYRCFTCAYSNANSWPSSPTTTNFYINGAGCTWFTMGY